MDALKEFHDTFAPDQRGDDYEAKLERRGKLIHEEFDEVMEAIQWGERVESGWAVADREEVLVQIASELADLLYVVYGTAEELSIPLQEVFQAIHKANMSKVWDDGTVHRNDYGKVIKPPNFVKADIRKVMYGEREG
jgi:predicted HAD superfamily Cof-like phosphohydrolase